MRLSQKPGIGVKDLGKRTVRTLQTTLFDNNKNRYVVIHSGKTLRQS